MWWWVFFFKQKTAYEMRISDWSSDVCSSDLLSPLVAPPAPEPRRPRVLLVGAALGAAASSLVVLASLAVYLQVRGDRLAEGTTALPEGIVLPLTPGNLGLLTLSMSVITMAWAAYALRNDDRHHASLAIRILLLLVVASLTPTAILY